jgi:hypothetical protein
MVYMLQQFSRLISNDLHILGLAVYTEAVFFGFFVPYFDRLVALLGTPP